MAFSLQYLLGLGLLTGVTAGAGASVLSGVSVSADVSAPPRPKRSTTAKVEDPCTKNDISFATSGCTGQMNWSVGTSGTREQALSSRR